LSHLLVERLEWSIGSVRMHPFIEQHGDAIKDLCHRFEVNRLEVFGSAADSEFDPQQSDVNFLVELIPQTWAGASDRYFGLLFALEDLLGRPVDLVVDAAIRNPYFRQTVDESRKLLYAA